MHNTNSLYYVYYITQDAFPKHQNNFIIMPD